MSQVNLVPYMIPNLRNNLKPEEQELQQQLRQRGNRRQEKEEASGAVASGGRTKLRWRDGGRAPHKMCGEVALDGLTLYTPLIPTQVMKKTKKNMSCKVEGVTFLHWYLAQATPWNTFVHEL